MSTDVVKYKSVFKPGVARRLLHMGYQIHDIKPKKENPDATIFLFESTDKFLADFKKITEADAEKKE